MELSTTTPPYDAAASYDTTNYELPPQAQLVFGATWDQSGHAAYAGYARAVGVVAQEVAAERAAKPRGHYPRFVNPNSNGGTTSGCVGGLLCPPSVQATADNSLPEGLRNQRAGAGEDISCGIKDRPT
jgi:hypothetical protein